MTLAGSTLKNVSKQMPDPKIIESRSSRDRMKSSDFIRYKFSTYMLGEQEWVTGLEGGKIYTSDHWGISSGGQTIVEGPPFNYYNYQGDVRCGHIPVDSSREVYEAVKGSR